MELNPPVPIAGLDLDLVARLAAAAAIGLMLGLDREVRGHEAGLRTHGLICLAAAGMTVSILAMFGSLDAPRADPLRLYEAAGAFVGIIGAALVVFNKGQVHNLTTAAHLFLTAVAGIACGAAQWPLVAIVVPIGLIMLSGLRLLEDRLHKKDRRGAEDA